MIHDHPGVCPGSLLEDFGLNLLSFNEFIKELEVKKYSRQSKVSYQIFPLLGRTSRKTRFKGNCVSPFMLLKRVRIAWM